MGTTRWSDDHYHDRAKFRARTLPRSPPSRSASINIPVTFKPRSMPFSNALLVAERVLAMPFFGGLSACFAQV